MSEDVSRETFLVIIRGIQQGASTFQSQSFEGAIKNLIFEFPSLYQNKEEINSATATPYFTFESFDNIKENIIICTIHSPKCIVHIYSDFKGLSQRFIEAHARIVAKMRSQIIQISDLTLYDLEYDVPNKTLLDSINVKECEYNELFKTSSVDDIYKSLIKKNDIKLIVENVDVCDMNNGVCKSVKYKDFYNLKYKKQKCIYELIGRKSYLPQDPTGFTSKMRCIDSPCAVMYDESKIVYTHFGDDVLKNQTAAFEDSQNTILYFYSKLLKEGNIYKNVNSDAIQAFFELYQNNTECLVKKQKNLSESDKKIYVDYHSLAKLKKNKDDFLEIFLCQDKNLVTVPYDRPWKHQGKCLSDGFSWRLKHTIFVILAIVLAGFVCQWLIPIVCSGRELYCGRAS